MNALWLTAVLTLPSLGFELDDNFRYIENSNIRLGIDMDRGAAIGYLSAASNNINVVNIADMGREIQLSFYAGPAPFCASWNGSPWPWNPIGAGDVKGNKGKILLLEQPTNTSFHIITKPLQWPCNNVECECTFERIITLNGQRVDVVATLHNNRSDHKDYGAVGQELPAVYSIGTLYQLWTYNGSSPWTNDTMVRYSTAPNNVPWHPGIFPATESWAAMINDVNWGMGVVNLDTTQINGGFSGTPDKGGATDENCGYLAPYAKVDLTWNTQYTFKFSVILGYLDDIRKIVYDLHAENEP
eukprot:554003_1